MFWKVRKTSKDGVCLACIQVLPTIATTLNPAATQRNGAENWRLDRPTSAGVGPSSLGRFVEFFAQLCSANKVDGTV